MKRLILLAALALAGCSEPLHNVKVIDGDTFDAGEGRERTRYRLARIDAPEMGGRCRAGRTCAKGDPELARDFLAVAVENGVRCKGSKRDIYSRVIVECYDSRGRNISDRLLELGVVEKYQR